MTYSGTKLTIWFGVAVLAAGALISCKKEPQNGGQTSEDKGQSSGLLTERTGDRKQVAEDNSISSVIGHPSSEPATIKPIAPSKPTLRDIIAKRRGWGPAYLEWYGKDAPDFTVTDITGRKHTLSEYRGRNVMLTFWATWCGPCIKEIPHLIELRNTVGEDKLAILAISYIDMRNSTERVKKLIAANPVINYTVISTDQTSMPRPYNLITSIPSSFFIDPQGKIKLITEGMMSQPQMKAIIEADSIK